MWFFMFRFEALIDRNSRAIAKIYAEETGIRDASGFDFAHRRHRVHEWIRGSLMGKQWYGG